MKFSSLLKTFLLTGLWLAACNRNGELPSPTRSPSSTPGLEMTSPAGETPSVDIPTPLPSPGLDVSQPSRTLVICMGAEPNSLYLYDTPMHARQNILEAIYDGPINQNNNNYQPVILAKLPYLADGDAALQPVTVQEGEQVVDEDGTVTPLTPGIVVRPAGCQTSACAIPFAGGEIQMDQLSARFSLVEGVQWSDGQPLTAQDSVYSFQLDADPDTPTSKFRTERTASYTALDTRTVQWVGLPGFLDQTYQTNFWHPLPQHVWGDFSPAELLQADLAIRRPLGWGPYVVTEWRAGEAIHLARNPHYFRANEGLPKFDTLIFRFVTGNPTMVESLLSGECDLMDIEATQAIPYADLFALQQDGQIQVHLIPFSIWEHADFGIVPAAYDDGYQLGVDRPDFFGDVRTRRAIAMCMDREAVLREVLYGKSLIPTTYLPPTHSLYNANVPDYPFDPTGGMALLEEVGWRDTDGSPSTPRIAQGVPNVPDGTPLSFNYWTTTSTQRQQVMQILVASLAECGVQINVQTWEPAALFAEGPDGPLFGRQFDMAQLSWLTDATPPCDLYLTEQIPGEDMARFPYRWGGPHLPGYSNPAFDEACQQALSLLPGQPGYLEAHALAQQLFAEELPVIPLYFRLWVTAARPDFCGHEADATMKSDFPNLEAYDYGEGCSGRE